MGTFRVGLDFDNTIADYDAAFAATAVEMGFLAPGAARDKRAVRAALRARPDGERDWMRVQGRVYGPGIGAARPYPGVLEALGAFARRGLDVCVVSHKTRTGHFDETGTDLRAAAIGWMAANGLFDAAHSPLARQNVHFAETRAAKIAAIAALSCDAFVDDLEEVLLDPAFPADVERILFAPDGAPAPAAGVRVCADWDCVARAVDALAVAA